MISLKQINYALAVGKTRHFKKAAELCHVSQSTLSSAISELENQLNIMLFERDNKNVFITPLGEQFLQKAKQIKMLTEDLYLMGQESDKPFSYPITLGVIPTIGPYLLPKVLPPIRHEFPEIRLNIVEDKSEVLVEKVRNGEIDTAILALPYPVEGLHAFKFWQEDFFFIEHKDNVSKFKPEVASSDINPDDLMLLEDGHCFKDHALAVCKLPQMTNQHAFKGASLYTLIQMVATKMGTTLLPQMALSQLVTESSELSASHLNEPGPHRELALITRLNYPYIQNIETLMRVFKQALQQAD